MLFNLIMKKRSQDWSIYARGQVRTQKFVCYFLLLQQSWLGTPFMGVESTNFYSHPDWRLARPVIFLCSPVTNWLSSYVSFWTGAVGPLQCSKCVNVTAKYYLGNYSYLLFQILFYIQPKPTKEWIELELLLFEVREILKQKFKQKKS